MSLRQSGTEKVTALVNAITGLITSHNNNSNAHSTEMAKKVDNTDSRLSDARTPTSHTHGSVTNDGKIGTASGKIITTGTSGVLQASDSITKSQISDFPSTMTPSSHTHGNLTNDGKIGSTSGKPIITTTSGKLTTGSFGTSSGTFCQGNDSRLSNARTPTAHTHTKSQITDFRHEHGYDEDVFTIIDINNNESEYLQLNSDTGMGLYAKWNGAFNIPTANTWVDVKDLNTILHNETGNSNWNIEVLGTSWSSNVNYGVQGIFFLRAKRAKISAYCNVTGEVNHTSFTIPFFFKWVENDTS